jgi:hypothetical protein
MPRKSVEELLTPSAVVAAALKPDAPYDFSERKAEVWRAVVGSLPADYFSPAQQPHLRSYCTAVVQLQQAEAKLEHAQARKHAPRQELLDKYLAEVKYWLETENRLARSMRLTHQSVYQHTTANTAHKRGKASAADIMRELNEEAFGE